MATSRSEAASLQLLSRIGSAGQLCLASRQPAAVRLRGITLRHHHNTNSTLQGHGIAAKRYSRGFSSNPVSALAAPTDTNRTKQKSNNVTTSSVPSSDGKRKIAVLGGGLTGLTAAHYLARHAPDAQITLFEASDTMGGWVQGREVDTTEGRVTMQSGPRMIRSMKSSNRYDDLVFYDVLASLDIDDQLKDVGQQAGTRYLYYPDHLVRLPGPPMTLDNIISTARSLYEEPLWDGLLPSVFNYFMKSGPQPPTPERRAAMDKDESVGHFLERLCGDDRLVKNVVSAMMHGIHGGDVYKLSAKHTLFNKLWYQTTGGGDKTKTWMPYKELSLLCDIMDGPNRAKVCELAWKGENSNMLAFDDGMLTLVHALEQDLQSQKQVKIKTQTPVTSLAPVDGGKVRLEYKSPKGTTSEQFDKVISTITAKQLSKLARPEGSLSVLGETHAVTIQVVNLWYPESGLLKDNPGFGFLVPVGTPNNDASLLGVIFDSEAQASDLEPGTKLTVMMGGHHWDGNTYLPTAEQGVEMAKNAVTKILGIPRMPGMLATERMCYECLPQHLVGHRKLMARAHEQLLQTFRGGLSVAGPSFTSAGVMPSMRAGYDAAMRVATQKTQPWPRVSLSDDQSWWSMLPEVENDQGYKVFRGDHIGETGLAAFTQPDGDTLERVSMEALFFRNNSSEAAGALDSHGKPTQWIGTPLIKYPQ